MTRIAILYQAIAPPVINGLRKAPKPGGYSDSGADIAFALLRAGHDVLTPTQDPDATKPKDFVFPDTEAGIADAIDRGSDVIWANTVLFKGHPLERVIGKVGIVGQLPELVQEYDDKFYTNGLLARHGLPVAQSVMLSAKEIDESTDFAFPVMLKPVRGRGSQGVVLTRSLDEIRAKAHELMTEGEFGDRFMVEEFLDGKELTITVMPPLCPRPSGFKNDNSYWALRPVWRLGHDDGVAPYNGTVAVTTNSRALTEAELAAPEVMAAVKACTEAASIVGARAPIRIDCRENSAGEHKLFDLNMKPNLTGAGRPGRDDQDSLCTLAAAADGWDYTHLLESMLAGAWHK